MSEGGYDDDPTEIHGGCTWLLIALAFLAGVGLTVAAFGIIGRW